MNITSIIGYLSALLVLYLGIYKGAADPNIFLDKSSIIIVIGGTVSVLLVIFPVKKLMDLFDFIFFKVVFKSNDANLNTAKQIINIFLVKDHKTALRKELSFSHPFLRDAMKILKNENYSANQVNAILTERINNIKKNYNEDTKALFTLAKFPPAFGLLGSVTGIISMMSGLGASGADQIGPAMAVTLVTTFWGIAISNLFILPLADHSEKATEEELHTRNMIRSAVVAMKLNGQDGQFLIDTLLGFLKIKERPDLKKHLKKQLNIDTSSDTYPTRKSA